MKKTLINTMAALLAALPLHAGDIYVSPRGSDSASGTQSAPLLSPDKALRLAREWRRLGKVGASEEVRIHLDEGTYRLLRPIFLRPEDSGTPSSPTIIEGSANGKSVVSGGISVSGWRKMQADARFPQSAQGSIWVADAPKVGNRIVYARQMWVGGEKAVRAQQGAPGELTRIVDFNKERRSITIPTPKEDLSGADRLEMLVHQRWAIAILRVKDMRNLGSGATEVTFLEPESTLEFEHPWPQPVIGGERGNSSFCLVNAPALLEQPGEWYQDYPSGKIYYLPRKGEDMTSVETTVPLLEQLIVADGSRERTVHDIQFRNLTIAHAAWTDPDREGLVTLQGGFPLIDAYKLQEPGLPEKASLENQAWVRRPVAAVSLRHGRGISFKKCQFNHLAATALDYVFAVSSSTIEGCKFSDIGGNAILVGHFPDGGFETHVPYKPTIATDLCDGINITDNEITDATNEDWGCVGIGAGYVSNISITGNTVHRLNYSGICVGWGWTPLESGMHDNRITGNSVYDYARQLYDAGGIYTLSNQPGSVITGNTIGAPFNAPYATNERAFHIYFDEATDGFTVENNNFEGKARIGYNQPGPSMKVDTGEKNKKELKKNAEEKNKNAGKNKKKR